MSQGLLSVICLLIIQNATSIEDDCHKSSTKPCVYSPKSCNNCSQQTQDIFNCYSNIGCIVDCSSASCENVKINNYASGTVNIICNDNISCNNINITIQPIYIENNNNSDTTFVFMEFFTTPNLIQYIIIISVFLICCMNILCCFYWICCRNKNNNPQHQHQHIETLKPPNNSSTQIKHTNQYYDNNADEKLNHIAATTAVTTIELPDMECYDVAVDDQAIEYEHNLEYDSQNDLENAPALDLRELDDSDSFNGMEQRKDPEITFWSQQPESPKKRTNIEEETKRNFEEDGDDKNNTNEDQDMDEIQAPDITNTDNTLPIPPKFDVNFKFLNPTKEPSHFAVITPRGFGGDTNSKSPKISDAELKKINDDENSDLFLRAPEKEVVNGNVNIVKSKSGKTGKFLKDKSRELISKEDIYSDLNNLGEEKPGIVKFNVNSIASNKLAHIIMENKEISNRHRKHKNKRHFKREMGLTLSNIDSPRSMSNNLLPSPSPNSKSASISPRNIINKIMKLSPRNYNENNGNVKEIQHLIVQQNISTDHDDDDENEYLSNKIVCDDT